MSFKCMIIILIGLIYLENSHVIAEENSNGTNVNNETSVNEGLSPLEIISFAQPETLKDLPPPASSVTILSDKKFIVEGLPHTIGDIVPHRHAMTQLEPDLAETIFGGIEPSKNPRNVKDPNPLKRTTTVPYAALDSRNTSLRIRRHVPSKNTEYEIISGDFDTDDQPTVVENIKDIIKSNAITITLLENDRKENVTINPLLESTETTESGNTTASVLLANSDVEKVESDEMAAIDASFEEDRWDSVNGQGFKRVKRADIEDGLYTRTTATTTSLIRIIERADTNTTEIYYLSGFRTTEKSPVVEARTVKLSGKKSRDLERGSAHRDSVKVVPKLVPAIRNVDRDIGDKVGGERNFGPEFFRDLPSSSNDKDIGLEKEVNAATVNSFPKSNIVAPAGMRSADTAENNSISTGQINGPAIDPVRSIPIEQYIQQQQNWVQPNNQLAGSQPQASQQPISFLTPSLVQPLRPLDQQAQQVGASGIASRPNIISNIVANPASQQIRPVQLVPEQNSPVQQNSRSPVIRVILPTSTKLPDIISTNVPKAQSHIKSVSNGGDFYDEVLLLDTLNESSKRDKN